MKSFLEFVASSLVDDPAGVRIREVRGPQGMRYELRVASGEIGRVIGREGRTSKAIRCLIALAGRKAGKRYTLEIAE